MEYVRIGDICKKVCSGGTPSSGNSSYYEGGTIPWLNTNEVNFCRIYSTEKKITQLGYEKSAAKYIDENSVIVAMYGVTAGRSAIAKIKLTTNQACCNLSIDSSKADYEYVYYYLKLQSEILNKLANGGAQQNLNSKIIKDFKIPLPPLATQHRIASILSVYDSQIENNLKRIKLLEQMAENLYKEWFVRFRFPGYENAEFEGGIPKGWKDLQAQDVFNITIGRTPSRKVFEFFSTERENNCSWISISDMKNGMFIKDTSEYLTPEALKACNMPMVKANTVLLSFKLTVGKVAISLEETSTNEAIAHFNTDDNTLKEYTYLYLKCFNYSKLGNTSAIGNAINSTIVKNMSFILPSKDIILEFHKQAKPLFDEILNLTQQISSLTHQRDLLLPRLMSGKLSI